MHTFQKTLTVTALLLLFAGCTSIGCQMDPLHPKKALRCEIPLGNLD